MDKARQLEKVCRLFDEIVSLNDSPARMKETVDITMKGQVKKIKQKRRKR
jgi:hypothetical protein